MQFFRLMFYLTCCFIVWCESQSKEIKHSMAVVFQQKEHYDLFKIIQNNGALSNLRHTRVLPILIEGSRVPVRGLLNMQFFSNISTILVIGDISLIQMVSLIASTTTSISDSEDSDEITQDKIVYSYDTSHMLSTKGAYNLQPINPRLSDEGAAMSSLILSTNQKQLHLLAEKTLVYDGFIDAVKDRLGTSDDLELSLQLIDSSGVVDALREILAYTRVGYMYMPSLILLHCPPELVSDIMRVADILFYDRQVIWLMTSAAAYYSMEPYSYPGMVTLVQSGVTANFLTSTISNIDRASSSGLDGLKRTPLTNIKYYSYSVVGSMPDMSYWIKIGEVTSEKNQSEMPDLMQQFSYKDKKTIHVATAVEEPFLVVQDPHVSEGEMICQTPAVPCLDIPDHSLNVADNILQKTFQDYQLGEKKAERPYEVKCCKGFVVDLLKSLAVDLDFHFNLYLSPDGQFGAYDKVKGNWTGLVYELLSNRADMVLASFSITSVRAAVIDYSSPYYYSGIAMMSIQREDKSLRILSFLDPFPLSIYPCVIALALVTSVCQALFEWFSPSGLAGFKQECSNKLKAFTLGSSIKVVFSLLCGNIIPCKRARSWPAMWTQNVWASFSIIYLAAYTANLTSSLADQMSLLKINDLYDPNLKNLKVAALHNSASEAYINQINTWLYQDMRKFSVTSREQGIQMLRSGDLDIMIGDTPPIDYLVNKRNFDCKLARINTFSVGSYGAAFPKGKHIHLKEAVTDRFLKYHESGYMEKLRELYLSGVTGCSGPHRDSHIQLTLLHSCGLFIFLGGFAVLTFGLLGVETLIFKYLLPIARRQPLDSIWKRKFCFFISQRYYTSVVGVKKKNQAGVFKGLAKRISQARLFLSEIIPLQSRISKDEYKWTFYDVVQHAYARRFSRPLEHIFITKQPDMPAFHNMTDALRHIHIHRPHLNLHQKHHAATPPSSKVIIQRKANSEYRKRSKEYLISPPALDPIWKVLYEGGQQSGQDQSDSKPDLWRNTLLEMSKLKTIKEDQLEGRKASGSSLCDRCGRLSLSEEVQMSHDTEKIEEETTAESTPVIFTAVAGKLDVPGEYSEANTDL